MPPPWRRPLPKSWPLICLVAVIAISVAVDVWWLHRFRVGYPLDIDESRYLELGLRLSDGLNSGGLSTLWHVWSTQNEFGPLLPLVSVPVFLVAGHTLLGGLATQLVFFVLLVLASYGLGRRLRSPAAGLVAAMAVAGSPVVIDFARTYQFAVTDAAVLAAATYALLASEALTRRGWALGWGALLGLLPLARTMAVAFIPGQVFAALWLIYFRPTGRRGRQLVTLAGAGVLGVAVAAIWLAYSAYSVFSYLNNFGYGSHSGAFSHSGSRLAVGYWTREATALVREDLYLPLAALLVVCLILGAASAWRARGHPGQVGFRSTLRRWAASDSLVVGIVLLEGYLAVSSSRNEGVGFRVPLIAELIVLAVAALFTVRRRGLRSAVVAALVVVCAVNVVMKADVTDALSSRERMSVPGVGSVPVLDGLGYIQSYVIESTETAFGSATQPLPRSQRDWLSAYQRIVSSILDLAHAGHYRPVVDLATDEPLLNANDLTLAARLQAHRDLPVTLLPGPAGASTLASYERLLHRAVIRPNVIVTVTRVGLSYFALGGLKDADQGLLERASEAAGFSCGAAIPLPDGRLAVVSRRAPGLRGRPTSTACAPRVVRVSPGSHAHALPRRGQIFAEFDLPMQSASLTGAFRLVNDRSGHKVPGTITPFGEIVLLFRPARTLPAGTHFTATVAPGVTAATNATLAAAYRWTFRTPSR